MRKKDNGFLILVGIVLLVICGIFVYKFLTNNETKAYQNYVKEMEDAILEYCDNEMAADFDSVVYSYDELKNILISKGHIKEFSDSSVIVTAEPITFSKSNGQISLYNYNNLTTFENRFELKFQKDGKTYTCTKNGCE